MAVALRVCLVLTTGALATSAAMTPAHADTFFQAQTTAAAVQVSLTQKPASSIITADLFNDALSYAASSFDSGGASEALAAPVFPGLLVVQGPQLLCSQLFSCPTQPPNYPLLADASYPRRQHDQATISGSPIGSGPFTATPLTASATATATTNSGRTAAGTMTLLAGTPAAVSVGASTATSSVRSTASAIDVRVASTVSDVTVGGLLHVGSVRAVTDLVLRTGQRPQSRPSLSVTDVTVAGQRASIDDQGVHVAGADGPSLERELAQHGISVHTVGAHHSHTATGGRADATGLQVDFSVPVKGTPYIPNPLPPLPPPFDQIPEPGVNANGDYLGHVTLGAVGAAAGVGEEPTFTLGGAGTIPTPPPATTAPGNSTAAPPPGGGSLVSALASTPPPTTPAVAQPPQRPVSGITDLLSRDQLDILYAVLALGTLVLFIGWRGSMLWSRRHVVAGRGPR